jgi:hypothetical protein
MSELDRYQDAYLVRRFCVGVFWAFVVGMCLWQLMFWSSGYPGWLWQALGL